MGAIMLQITENYFTIRKNGIVFIPTIKQYGNDDIYKISYTVGNEIVSYPLITPHKYSKEIFKISRCSIKEELLRYAKKTRLIIIVVK